MRKQMMAICIIILMVMVAAVSAAGPRAKRGGGGSGGGAQPEYWPGEQPPSGDRDKVAGKVTYVDANSIALQTRRGEVTFAVTDKTKVVVRGEPAKITDVKKGDVAFVKFTLGQDGSRIAVGVLVPKPVYRGRITAVSDDSFTLTGKEVPDGKEGAWTVIVSSETKIQSHGYMGTMADLRVGYGAGVHGDLEGDTIKAKVVNFQPPAIRGVVTAVNGYDITVQTIRGHVVTVVASDATAVIVMPRTTPNRKGTLADVKPDMAINVGGHRTGEAIGQALWIELLVGRDTGGGGSPGTLRRRR